VELLRQFLDFKGFYDRDKLFWKDITDTMLFTGAAPPGGGRSVVTPRFTRHYNVFCVPPASEAVMRVIFESIFSGFMKPFDKDVQRLVGALAACYEGAFDVPSRRWRPRGRIAGARRHRRDATHKSGPLPVNTTLRAGGVVAATIEVYNSISAELLPTPAKFHYTFNLRDISKVFQGMLMISPVKCKDQDTLSKLWLHEAQRVFYDRLINEEDQQWFERLACELLSRHLGQMLSPEQIFGENSVLFCDFMKAGVDVENRRYELGGIDKITALLGDALDEYNVSFPTRMNLVFFSDAVRHIARMSRILRQPRGNAMLVGVGGSGKQSTTRMAAFIGQMPCSISASRGPAVPSRHRRDSCSSDEVVGGLFFDFEAVRTASRHRDAPRRSVHRDLAGLWVEGLPGGYQGFYDQDWSRGRERGLFIYGHASRRGVDVSDSEFQTNLNLTSLWPSERLHVS
jgi:dynein heavy chain